MKFKLNRRFQANCQVYQEATPSALRNRLPVILAGTERSVWAMALRSQREFTEGHSEHNILQRLWLSQLKIAGVEGWDDDMLQIKRSPYFVVFTKARRFSTRSIPSCSLRPSSCPLLTRWFVQTSSFRTMVSSCSVCESQANTQSKLVVLEVGSYIIAVLTVLQTMPCCGRGEMGASSHSCTVQVNEQSKMKGPGIQQRKNRQHFLSDTSGSCHQRRTSQTSTLGAQGLQLGSEPFCHGHHAAACTHNIHKTSPRPKQPAGFKMLWLSEARGEKGGKTKTGVSIFRFPPRMRPLHPVMPTPKHLSPTSFPSSAPHAGWNQLPYLRLTQRPFAHHITSLKVLGREKTDPQVCNQISFWLSLYNLLWKTFQTWHRLMLPQKNPRTLGCVPGMTETCGTYRWADPVLYLKPYLQLHSFSRIVHSSFSQGIHWYQELSSPLVNYVIHWRNVPMFQTLPKKNLGRKQHIRSLQFLINSNRSHAFLRSLSSAAAWVREGLVKGQKDAWHILRTAGSFQIAKHSWKPWGQQLGGPQVYACSMLWQFHPRSLRDAKTEPI